MIWDFHRQLEYVTENTTIKRPTLFFSGTPGGVGAAQNPQDFIKAGYRIAVSLFQGDKNLGTLVNDFRDVA